MFMNWAKHARGYIGPAGGPGPVHPTVDSQQLAERATKRTAIKFIRTYLLLVMAGAIVGLLWLAYPVHVLLAFVSGNVATPAMTHDVYLHTLVVTAILGVLYLGFSFIDVLEILVALLTMSALSGVMALGYRLNADGSVNAAIAGSGVRCCLQVCQAC